MLKVLEVTGFSQNFCNFAPLNITIMQKYLVILSFIFLLTSCTSKKDEVVVPQITFCSVPLSGNIDDFTKKLAGEGVKLNKEIDTNLQDGSHAYDVKMFEHPCLARVEFNTVTRNVYEATLMFNIQSNYNSFTSFRDSFMGKLKEKYSSGVFSMESKVLDYNAQSIAFNGYTGCQYVIYNSQTNTQLGDIYMYWDAKDFDIVSQNAIYMFHVMYRNTEAPPFDITTGKYY